jgi:hypothetical protein
MRNILCVLCTVILISSCTRDIDIPKPLADPLLKRTVQTDTLGAILRVAYYNEFELVTLDTTFLRGTRNPGMSNISTYNAKGKRTRLENTIQVLYTGGYYWAFQDHYLDDTLPTVSYRYLRGNQVAEITHFYNASRQLIKDSTYHTPNYGTFTYLTKYEYDASGRLSSSLDLNDKRDTSKYITYRYSPNTVEKFEKSFDYYIPYVLEGYSKIVTEYTASGKILSEKQYGGEIPRLITQIDYTYDAGGHLLKKTTIHPGSATQEERYTNNSTTGKPEKMQNFVGDVPGYITFYYYE